MEKPKGLKEEHIEYLDNDNLLKNCIFNMVASLPPFLTKFSDLSSHETEKFFNIR